MKTVHLFAVAMFASLSVAACGANVESEEDTSTSDDALTQSVELGRGANNILRLKSDFSFPQSRVESARVSWRKDTTCGTLFACPLPNGGSPSTTYCKIVPNGGSQTITGPFQLNLMSERDGVPCNESGGNAHGFATIESQASQGGGGSTPPAADPECPSGKSYTVTKNTLIDHVVNDKASTIGVVGFQAYASSPYYKASGCYCQPTVPFIEFKLCGDDGCTRPMGTDEYYPHRQWLDRMTGYSNTPKGSRMTLVASSLTNKPVKVCVRNIRTLN